jgi:protein-tyrosine-phosphatase
MSDVEQINKQRQNIIQIANKYGMDLSEDTPMTMKQVEDIVIALDIIIQIEKKGQKDVIGIVQEQLSEIQSDLDIIGKLA